MRDRVIAVFDFDGTITRYDSFVRFLSLVLRKYPERLISSWELPIDVVRHKCGWRDNTWLKQRFMRKILRNLHAKDLESVTHQLHDGLLEGGFRTGAMKELNRHISLGHRTLLLSASLDIYLKPIAANLGFSDCGCSVAERDAQGALTGRLRGANCLNFEKVHRLNELIGTERNAWRVIAYGDSAADLPLLEAADEGYMINASQRLARQSEAINAQTIQW
jgi:HAD superfamily hydrolase (TIGR01490 family)